MDTVTFVLHRPSGETFSGWLRKRAEEMGQRWEGLGETFVLVEYTTQLDEWLYPEAPDLLPEWMYQVAISVELGEPSDKTYTQITFETYPLNFPTRQEGIQVTARYEPHNELPEMRGYFERLLEEVTQAYPEAVPPLQDQGYTFGTELPSADTEQVPEAAEVSATSFLVGGNVELDDIDDLIAILEIEVMQEHYDDYSPPTAAALLKAIPEAYDVYLDEGGQWGPGYVGAKYGMAAETVGRYFRALTEAGVESVIHIPIPHRRRTADPH